jgi:NADPH-dependent glutamate synthase beta subunit-like oxidoreductase
MTALPEEIEGAIAEGCQLFQLKAPSEIIVDKNGQVKGLYVQPQIASEADKSGRPKPVDADQPREKLMCDIIISAIGQATDLEFFEKYGVPVFKGNIKTERNHVVDPVRGIYAGGERLPGTVKIAYQCSDPNCSFIPVLKGPAQMQTILICMVGAAAAFAAASRLLVL